MMAVPSSQLCIKLYNRDVYVIYWPEFMELLCEMKFINSLPYRSMVYDIRWNFVLLPI
jgi:hypothetical protein